MLQDQGFIHVHTPILTSNDCEGGGDLFHVLVGNTTFKCAAIVTFTSLTTQILSVSLSSDPLISPQNSTQPAREMCPPSESSDTEQSRSEFFNSPVYLTVSGQLHAEAITWCVLTVKLGSKKNTIGPVLC